MSGDTGHTPGAQWLLPTRPLTADEAALCKMALKRDPVTPQIKEAAENHPIEAAEALWEVESGYDFAAPGSWVAGEIA